MIDILCTTIVAIIFLLAVLLSRNKYAYLAQLHKELRCQYLGEKIAKELLGNLPKQGEWVFIEEYNCHWLDNGNIQCSSNTALSNLTATSRILLYNNNKIEIIDVIVVCGDEG